MDQYIIKEYRYKVKSYPRINLRERKVVKPFKFRIAITSVRNQRSPDILAETFPSSASYLEKELDRWAYLKRLNMRSIFRNSASELYCSIFSGSLGLGGGVQSFIDLWTRSKIKQMIRKKANNWQILYVFQFHIYLLFSTGTCETICAISG